MCIIDLHIQNESYFRSSWTSSTTKLICHELIWSRSLTIWSCTPPWLKCRLLFLVEIYSEAAAQFKYPVSCHLQNGPSVLLWRDNWHTQNLHQIYPHSTSFGISLDVSFLMAAGVWDLLDGFHLPLIEVVFEQSSNIYVLFHYPHFEKKLCSSMQAILKKVMTLGHIPRVPNIYSCFLQNYSWVI